ncbi:hypothetical protein C1A50_2749 [Paenibacillus polymyxa]|nr:hypothetical protein C1A50_2749 [Paenibacillus polymyxa]
MEPHVFAVMPLFQKLIFNSLNDKTCRRPAEICHQADQFGLLYNRMNKKG